MLFWILKITVKMKKKIKHATPKKLMEGIIPFNQILFLIFSFFISTSIM